MARRKPGSSGDRPSPGELRRDRILQHAIKMASAHGLEALTIGRMAGGLGMSKSGLFAHFGSKQKLQLATIERAKEIFDQAVLQPAGETTVGTERLWRLCDVWLWHLEDRVFPSGYFFTGAFLEYGPRQGPLASSLQQIAMIWMKSIERSVQQAQDKKELRSEPSAERMAFELNAMLVGAYWARLAGYGDAYSTARVTILSRLRSGATHRIPSDAFKSVNTWRRYLRAHVKRSSGK